MRYLGLDLGTKTLGVSLSDRLGLIASTYKTIRFNENDYESALNQLEEIISEFKVEKIVLGLPKNMNNSLGFASERSMNFKNMIEEKYNIEVILQDERLSSVEANNIMIKNDTSRKKRKKRFFNSICTPPEHPDSPQNLYLWAFSQFSPVPSHTHFAFF